MRTRGSGIVFLQAFAKKLRKEKEKNAEKTGFVWVAKKFLNFFLKKA